MSIFLVILPFSLQARRKLWTNRNLTEFNLTEHHSHYPKSTMANTSDYKNLIEPWFRSNYVALKHPEAEISQDKIGLKWGGLFEVDAVARRGATIDGVYCLSCAEYLTHGGKAGSGKFNKIRADVLMLLGVEVPVRCIVFTGRGMYERVVKEQNNGRLPQEITFDYLPLTEALSTVVSAASARAVAEVTPGFVYSQPYTDFDPSTGRVTFEVELEPSENAE